MRSSSGIVIFEKNCKRCNYVWATQKELPRVCPKCRSPYWEREPMAKRYPEIYALKPGESVVVPWPENHVVGGSQHPAVRIVKKLNQEAALEGRRKFPFSCWKFDGIGAHVSRAANDTLSIEERKILDDVLDGKITDPEIVKRVMGGPADNNKPTDDADAPDDKLI